MPVPITVFLCSLYTCVLEAPAGREARKWLQLAVFCSPLAPGQSHLQLRIYFLNNTPCALRWAVANEQPHGGRLRGPCQLFDFTGARGDQRLKLKYISEGEGGSGLGDRVSGSPTRGRGSGPSPGWKSGNLEFLLETPGQAMSSRGPRPRLCLLPPSKIPSALASPWEDRMMQSRARGGGAFIVPPGWGWCLERSPSLLCPPSFVALAAALSHGAEDICVARAQGTGA